MSLYATYVNQLNRYRWRAHEGLQSAFADAVAAIPGGVGSILDTLIGFNGVYFNAHPLRALFGYPFYFFGFALGYVAQIAFNIPCLLGHYLLDWPLSLLFPRVGDAMAGTVKKWFGVQPSYDADGRETERVRAPAQMNGVFGFLAGVIPEAIRFGVSGLTAQFSTSMHFIGRGVAAGIKAAYFRLGRGIDRVRGVVHSENPMIEQALRLKIDIFTELDITPQQVHNNSFDKTKIRQTIQRRHPLDYVGKTDKVKQVRYARAHLAEQILTDEATRVEYMAHYVLHPSLFGAGSATLFATSASKSNDTVPTLGTDASRRWHSPRRSQSDDD